MESMGTCTYIMKEIKKQEVKNMNCGECKKEIRINDKYIPMLEIHRYTGRMLKMIVDSEVLFAPGYRICLKCAGKLINKWGDSN